MKHAMLTHTWRCSVALDHRLTFCSKGGTGMSPGHRKKRTRRKEGDKNQEDVILLSVSNISPRKVFLLIISSIPSLSFGEI